mmetsp:Transcript_93266/g.207487  ORF Transcript_93266/g.207487 Transcript_93266/m.207487 type:complete len:342 (-) Transcript_93266:104-1129(-)
MDEGRLAKELRKLVDRYIEGHAQGLHSGLVRQGDGASSELLHHDLIAAELPIDLRKNHIGVLRAPRPLRPLDEGRDALSIMALIAHVRLLRQHAPHDAQEAIHTMSGLHSIQHLHEPRQKGHIGAHGVHHTWVDHLENHLLAALPEAGTVHLGDGGCRQGLLVDGLEGLLQGPAQPLGDRLPDQGKRQSTSLVATDCKRIRNLLWNHRLLRGDVLAHLHLEAAVLEKKVPEGSGCGLNVCGGLRLDLLLGPLLLINGVDLSLELLVLPYQFHHALRRRPGAPSASCDVQDAAEEASEALAGGWHRHHHALVHRRIHIWTIPVRPGLGIRSRQRRRGCRGGR